MKRILALMLALTLIIFTAGCSTEEAEGNNDTASVPDAERQKGLTLLYCATDSLNPYKTKTDLNREIIQLIFDPLVKLDGSFEPQYILASSATVEGKVCTVTLRDAVFSDGSKVTNDDVIYSYKLAKAAEDEIYATELAEVTSCSAGDNNTVIFKLTKSDPYFANLLSFPIIKSGSEKRTDEDNIVLPPIGSGLYTVNTQNATLNANELHLGDKPGIKTIGLINAPDSEIVNYNLEAGNVGIYGTDLYDGVIPSMSGNYIKYNLNNLVFIGVNCVSGVMKNVQMRYAVSDIIDRSHICETCYYSYATPAAGLFSSAWKDASGSQNIQSTPSTQNIVAYFDELGYNRKNKEDYYENAVGTTITLRLIFNSENAGHRLTAASVAQSLNDAGIKTYVKELSRKEYLEALSSRNFDLYIGEVRLLNNMDVTSIVTSTGKLAYGLKRPEAAKTASSDSSSSAAPESGETAKTEDTNSSASADDTLDNAVKGFYGEKLSLTDIINAFNANMPIIPVCHRQGVTVCGAYLSVKEISSSDSIYYGIEKIGADQQTDK